MSRRRHHPTDGGWAWVVLVASLGSHFLNGSLVYSVGVLYTGLLHKFHSESITLVAMTAAVNTALVCTAGVGLGLTYSATNVTVGFYFDRLRGVASGISNSFQAVGILSGSVIFQNLIEEFGVSGTFLLLGAASLHFCFFGIFFRPTMYEGKTTEIAVEEPEKECQEILPSPSDKATVSGSQTSTPQSQHDEMFARGDTEVETKCLSEKDRERVADLKGYLIHGQSHEPDVTDDVTPDAVKTDDVTAEAVKTEGVSAETRNPGDVRVRGLGKGLISPTQHDVAVTKDRYDTTHVDDQSPLLTQEDQSEHNYQRLANKSISEAGVLDASTVYPPSNADLSDQSISRTTDPANICNISPLNTTEQTGKRISDAADLAISIPSPSASECILNSTPRDDWHHLSLAMEPLTSTMKTSEESGSLVIVKPVSISGEGGGQGSGRGAAYCESYRVLLSSTGFMLHCASLFMASLQVSGVFLHLPKYVQQQGTSPTKAAELFLAVGSTSLLSKLGCGFAQADPDIDPLTLSVGMMGLNGIVTAFFPLYADTYSKQVVFSLLFGLYFGGLYALSNPILVRFAGVARLADAYGISTCILGLGYFVGPTLAAMILDRGGTYAHSFLFLGITILSAAFLDMGAACFLLSRDKMEAAKQNADWLLEEKGVLGTSQSQTLETAEHGEHADWLGEDE
ncbi:uncharacterized protein LOC143275513 isoform X2 [Babylonia areolata]|uniref:uncharacterized protein LOC143275513 isoform X2 n=1 Tax=Babylonia areolata TaxID=304850 RepID=UPI003FD44184